MTSFSPPRLLRPERRRSLERPFAWLPCRLLRSDVFSQMSPRARSLYLLLVLAADPQGLSFHGDLRSQKLLGLALQDFEEARAELLRLDLIAFDNGVYQVLSLPSPRSQTRDTEPAVPSVASLPSASDKAPKARLDLNSASPSMEEARKTLRRLFGHDFGV